MSKSKKQKVSKSQQIRDLLKQGKTVEQIAKQTGATKNLVYVVMHTDKAKANHKIKLAKKAKKPSKIIAAVKETKTALDALGISKKPTIITLKDLVNDVVNHPPHYKAGGIETIDFIEAKDLNYRLGNVIKYVSRAGKKIDNDPVQDLEKAAFYLKREIEARKNA